MKQITEWWVVPINEDGDSLEAYYCDSKKEAIQERKDRAEQHIDAEMWDLLKVVRVYHNGGDLKDETITSEEWK